MKVTYKYKIGQKVKLANVNFRGEYRREDFFKPYLGKEVTIIERGFVYDDDSFNKRLEKDKIRFEMFYYIDVDPYYNDSKNNYGNLTRIPESALDGCGAWEEVEESFKGIDGIEIVPFESKIYDRIIERYERSESNKVETKANCNFVFATEGTCVGVRKNYEISCYRLNKKYQENYESREVKVAREFLTDFEPDEKHDWKTHPRQDAGAYGYETWHNLVIRDYTLGSVMSSIPDNYAEIYVKTATTDSFLRQCEFNPFFDCNFKWEIEQWLTRYGVYDKVKELWEKYRPGENKKKSDAVKEHEKFLKTAHKFIDSLTEKQKEELKKMLR